jgi:hypothetical protein
VFSGWAAGIGLGIAIVLVGFVVSIVICISGEKCKKNLEVSTYHVRSALARDLMMRPGYGAN